MSDSHRSYTDLVRDFYLVFQPIVLVDPSLKSQIEDYEVLLREKSTNAFPYKDFEYIIRNNEGNSVLLQWFSAELRHVCLCMPQVKIDINLNPQQLLFDSTLNFLNNLEDLADRINVEITETPSRVASMNNATMTERLREIVGLGFSATLDDVDSGDNNLNVVTQSAPYIDRIKLSLLAFDGKPAAQVDALLKKWQQFAEKYHLQLIVEGIESIALASTLEDSKFDLQQGFYWARPKMFDCLYKGR